jgi:hypothetical protein
MMGPEKIRKADFVTSVILQLFALWMLQQTLKMPMKDTFGGVRNVWYVSPALFPLCISVALFLLGSLLLVHSIRSGGARQFIAGLKQRQRGLSDSSLRFIAILLALISFVYLYIPRIDFFLCIILFLLFFISTFYFDEVELLKKLTLFYGGGSLVFLLLFSSGLSRVLVGAFKYSMDVLALLFFIACYVYTRMLVRGNAALRHKLRVTLIMTFVPPLLLVPVFRYFLLVPLPHEGGIIGIMNLIRFALR